MLALLNEQENIMDTHMHRLVNLVKFEMNEGIGPSKEVPSSFLQLKGIKKKTENLHVLIVL
jgi:hypothetical protein